MNAANDSLAILGYAVPDKVHVREIATLTYIIFGIDFTLVDQFGEGLLQADAELFETASLGMTGPAVSMAFAITSSLSARQILLTVFRQVAAIILQFIFSYGAFSFQQWRSRNRGEDVGGGQPASQNGSDGAGDGQPASQYGPEAAGEWKTYHHSEEPRNGSMGKLEEDGQSPV